MEIRDELIKGTTVGGMRTTNWAQVIETADAYLYKVAVEIPITTNRVTDLEKRLKAAGISEAFTDMKEADLIPVIMKTISKPETFIGQHQAKLSMCGSEPRRLGTLTREQRTANLKARQNNEKIPYEELDYECYDTAKNEWEKNLGELLEPGNI